MPVLAAGRLLDVVVRADPESCQTTATELARLGEACGLAGVRLAQQAKVGEDQLGGLSGIVYRQSTTDLGALADRLAADCGRLAAGLGDYARDVAEVHRLMGEAVAAATGRLRVTDQAVWSPIRPPDPTDAGADGRVGRLARRRRLVAAGPRARGRRRAGVVARPPAARPGRPGRVRRRRWSCPRRCRERRACR